MSIEKIFVGEAVISEVDFSRISQEDIAAWISYCSLMDEEFPLTPFQISRLNLASLPEFVTVRLFVARDVNGSVVADGRAVMISGIEDERNCQIHVSVHPNWRKRRIGTALLQLIADIAKATNRSTLVGWSTDRDINGKNLAQFFGASKLLDLSINKLLLAEVNRNTLERWRAQNFIQSQEYRIIENSGLYPENLLDGLLDLRILGNAGIPALLHEKHIFSKEGLRQTEALLTDKQHRLSLIAVHKTTGDIAGYTELFYQGANPHTANYAGTAVHPSHRRKGLGKRLKVMMLDRIATICPELKEICTANVALNEPILSINHALGFKQSMLATAWQVPVANIRALL